MTAPLPIQQIHHLARLTRHLDESRAFYRDVLGFREIDRPNFNFPGAWLFNYGLQIHLIVDENIPLPDETIQTRAGHLALHVDDVDAAERRLQELGVKYVRNEVPGRNVTQLFIRDPDGHHVEIGCYPPLDA